MDKHQALLREADVHTHVIYTFVSDPKPTPYSPTTPKCNLSSKKHGWLSNNYWIYIYIHTYWLITIYNPAPQSNYTPIGLSWIHETTMQPRPQILNLASRLNGASNYWGAAQTLQKWISVQPWRFLPLYKTCIIWQSRSFKNIAGCRFTDIQNFQDLSLGIQCQKKHVFKIVEVESLKFLSKDSSRTEASRPLFNQRSISPSLRSNTSVLNLQMSPKPHESFQGTNLMTFSFSMLLVLRTGMTPMAGVEAQKRWYKTCCCHMR